MLTKQIVFLAAGEGTRLGELTQKTPKPLLPVADKPFLDYHLENARRFGFEHAVILVGHLGEQIIERYENRSKELGIKITCVKEEKRSDTAGPLVYAKDILEDSFFLLNADSIFDFNLLDLSVIPSEGHWVGKIALREVSDTSHGGKVIVDDSGNVTEFLETGDKAPGFMNAGVYLLRKTIIDYITSVPASLERDIFPEVIKDGCLYAKKYDGYFIDIGTPDNYDRAQTELAEGLTRPAVFFDRDGVLNIDKEYARNDGGYESWVDGNFDWVDGAIEAVKFVNNHNHLAIVVTNQAGVARGYYMEEDIRKLHEHMNTTLKEHGAHIDAFYYCPHHPDGDNQVYAVECSSRKPGPGMIQRAMNEWRIIKSKSVLIGDNERDMLAAEAAGIKGYRYQGGDLLSFVKNISSLTE